MPGKRGTGTSRCHRRKRCQQARATLPEDEGATEPLPSAGWWVPAGSLQPGDCVAAAGGRALPVLAVRADSAVTSRVFNLDVAGPNTYLVGKSGAVVHNSCPNLDLGAAKKTNLNSNDATSNFGLYEIETPAGLEKVGKADLTRVTQSSGLPTRLHQQVRKLEKTHGQGNVKGTVVEDLGKTTTGAAKAAENARIKRIVDETGQVPPGNQKSYRP